MEIPFSGHTPFKVHVNFDILNFPEKSDVGGWILKLEKYF